MLSPSTVQCTRYNLYNCSQQPGTPGDTEAEGAWEKEETDRMVRVKEPFPGIPGQGCPNGAGR